MSNHENCVTLINDWCRDFVEKTGIHYFQTDIYLCRNHGRNGYRIFVDCEGIHAESKYVWFGPDELGEDNNLVGRELVLRWKEVRAYLIYQAEMKNKERKSIENFDVGPAYHQRAVESCVDKNVDKNDRDKNHSKEILTPGVIVEHFKRDFRKDLLTDVEASEIENEISQINNLVRSHAYKKEIENAAKAKKKRLEAWMLLCHPKMFQYRVIGVAMHTESKKDLVIYQALYPDENDNYQIFARPIDIFTGKVDKRKYPQSQREYVFSIVPVQIKIDRNKQYF